MKSQINKQLKKIESIALHKNEEIEKNYYDKYSYLYDILIEILKKEDILMYGGLAINELLPLKDKFYKSYELPDIDIFTYNAKPLLKRIIKYYKDIYHIELVSAKEALHENTYKIFSQGLQILDVTEIPKEDFNKLKKTSIKTKLDIYTVGIDYLKYTLHLLSSQSYDAHRWTKVYERLIKIYKHYPIKSSSIDWNEFYTSIPEDLYNRIQSWIQSENILSFGWDVLEKLLKPPTELTGYPILYLLYDGDIFELAKEFKWKNVKITEKYNGDTFVSQYLALSYDNTRFCYIFSTRSCLSILKKNKTTQLTLHSLITMLYTLYLSSGSIDFLPVIEQLSQLCLKYSNSPKKIAELYSSECYGSQSGIITLRRKHFIKRLENKNIFKK